MNKQVRTLIMKNDLDNLLILLLELYPTRTDEITVLCSRFKRIEDKSVIGSISFGDYGVERSRIVESIMKLVGEDVEPVTEEKYNILAHGQPKRQTKADFLVCLKEKHKFDFTREEAELLGLLLDQALDYNNAKTLNPNYDRDGSVYRALGKKINQFQSAVEARLREIKNVAITDIQNEVLNLDPFNLDKDFLLNIAQRLVNYDRSYQWVYDNIVRTPNDHIIDSAKLLHELVKTL